MFARRRKLTVTQTVHRSIWPRTGWRRAAVYFWKRIVRLTASPHAVAAGAAAGALASFTPLVGFHFILSFALAYLVRGNMLAAALGTAVGNPLTFPFIWGATLEVGRWILSGGEDAITAAGAEAAQRSPIGEGLLTVGLERLWPIMKPMLVGSVPLGLVAGVTTYVAVYVAVASFQKRRRAQREAREAAPAVARPATVTDMGGRHS
jgi:uncharacterized protein (DUF2062 family)